MLGRLGAQGKNQEGLKLEQRSGATTSTHTQLLPLIALLASIPLPALLALQPLLALLALILLLALMALLAS